MKIDPSLKNDFIPKQERTYVQAFYGMICKVVDAVKNIFYTDNMQQIKLKTLSTYSVEDILHHTNRKALPTTKDNSVFISQAEYIKSIEEGKPTVYLFKVLPSTSLNTEELRKLDNALHEIPADVLKIAHRISLADIREEKPMVLHSVECLPLDGTREQMQVVFEIDDKPVLAVFDADKFTLNHAEREMLPELMKEALEVFGVNVSEQST